MHAWSEHGSDHFHLEVGLSGGVDSVVLLHVLLALRQERHLPWHISAVHVNHQLQAPASEWVDFCQRLCQNWQVPLRVQAVDVVNQHVLGLEAAAREARYRVYRSSCADAVVLAHHADDQIETALLGWLRGGGIRSLVAMPLWRQLTSNTMLWRPLLSISKQDLCDYALQHRLTHVTDPSNDDTDLQRNWVRHEWLAVLLEQRPESRHKILAGIAQLQQELSILDDVQAQDWLDIYQNNFIHINKWLNLSSERRAQQLLKFSSEKGLGGWKKSKLRGFMAEIAKQPRSRHQVSLPNGTLFADKGRLFAWCDDLKAPFDAILSGEQVTFGKNSKNIPAKLAKAQGLGNTQMVSVVQLFSPMQLKTVLPEAMLHALEKRMKETQIPFFVRDYWPCWWDKTNQTVCLAGIEDRCLRQKLPEWNEKLHFLQDYLVKAMPILEKPIRS